MANLNDSDIENEEFIKNHSQYSFDKEENSKDEKSKELPGVSYFTLSGSGEAMIQNVDFRYPTRPTIQVLEDLNLNVQQGKTLALVGASGCGKSTVMQLLQRFYDPDSGIVAQDGISLSKLRLIDCRNSIGLVQQEPILFDKTIGENIAYGDNSRVVSMDEIIEVAKQANIHNFVSSLPLVVQEALDAAKAGRTCVVIAHRLSTVRDADVVCVLSGGRVAESGPHALLMERKGLYYNLHRSTYT